MVGRDFNDDKPDPYNIQKNFGGCDVIAIAKRPIENRYLFYIIVLIYSSFSEPVEYEKVILIEKIFRVPCMKYILGIYYIHTCLYKQSI